MTRVNELSPEILEEQNRKRLGPFDLGLLLVGLAAIGLGVYSLAWSMTAQWVVVQKSLFVLGVIDIFLGGALLSGARWKPLADDARADWCEALNRTRRYVAMLYAFDPYGPVD